MARMPRPIPQFRLSTLLWITLAVACWFGGMAVERQLSYQDFEAADCGVPPDDMFEPTP
jgi:hypothetical protein